jgi:transposase
MITFPPGVRVWLATGHTDMRRGFPSLALIVQEQLKQDPLLGTPVYLSWAQRRVDQSDLARRAGRLPVLQEAGAGAIYLANACRRGRDDLTGSDGLLA